MITRQNFYSGQKVTPDHLNTLQDYTEQYNADLISGVIGYGIVHGFEVSNNNMIVEVTSGLAYTEQGIRLESVGKNITIEDSEKPNTDIRTLKLSLRHSYIESKPELNSIGTAVNTILTPTVDLIVAETISEQDLYIADIVLNSSGIYQIIAKDIRFTTIPQQKETTDTLEEEVDQLIEEVNIINSMIQKNGSETNVVGSAIRINSILLADTVRNMIYPIGTYYTQYPNSINGKFDTSQSPQSLFGGVWELRFNNRGLFFRTEGGYAGESRNGSTGVQEYATRHHRHYTNINHSHTYLRSHNDNRLARTSGGNRYWMNDGAYWDSTYTSGGDKLSRNAIDGNSSSYETRATNMLMRIWERIV